MLSRCRACDDADVRASGGALGLPGLFDVHVHFLPPNVQRKVWAQFDQAGPLIGRPWPIRYRGADERAGRARCARSAYAASRRCPTPTGRGSRRTSTTGRAGFADRGPGVPVVGDVLPRAGGGGVRRGAARRRRRGVQGARAGGGVRPRRPAARRGLGRCSRTPARRSSCTPAPGRSATPSPGPARSAGCCERHPRLTAVVAHMGAPEYAEFLDARRALRAGAPRHHDGVHRLLRGRRRRSRATLLPRLRDLQRQVLLGTRLPEHPLPLRPPARGLGAARASATTGCARCAGTTAYACSADRRGISDARGWLVGPRRRGVPLDNSRGADRFRLGTLVPGEAGRGASVIS